LLVEKTGPYWNFSAFVKHDRRQEHHHFSNSGVIASIGYDAAWRVLEIEYRQTQEVYEYFEVPLEEYTAFRNAESKGTYLNTVFKPRGYRYVRVK
jgi:hypothetical protein